MLCKFLYKCSTKPSFFLSFGFGFLVRHFLATNMSHLDLTGCKKRRRGDRVFKFKSFGEHGYPTEFSGPFRENVKALLEFGHLETNLCGTGMHCWSFQLEVHRHPPVHILLFVIEELIGMSTNRHCKQCQFIGKVLHYSQS